MKRFALILFQFLVLVLFVECASIEKKQPLHDVWSGKISNTIYPDHQMEMEKSWSVMLNRKKQIDDFLIAKNYTSNRKTTVYPFSGIDVLNLFTFFPNSQSYVLFGLEDPGFPFEWETKNDSEKKIILKGIEELSNHLAGRNYFTYRKMKEETKKPALSGAYPVFVAFLRQLGKQVTSSKAETIVGPTETYKGFTLNLFDEKTKQNQSLTYFKIFLRGKEGQPGDGLYEYFTGLGEINIFTKSAEYLFHGEKRSLFRNILLTNAVQIVQDDSGFPIRLFPTDTWDRILYGRYQKSWNLSGAIEPEYQTEMVQLNALSQNEPLPFPFGYGVLGSKSQSQSLILVLRKKIK